MANEYRSKYRSTVEAQASAAILADAYSAGAQDTIDNSAAVGDYQGADGLDCYADVTVAPSSPAALEVWIEASHDGGTTYSKPAYALTVGVTETGLHFLGRLFSLPATSKLKLRAIDYGMTASLSVIPVLPEVQ